MPQLNAAKRIDDACETAGFINTAMVREGDGRRSCGDDHRA